jgi:hypothetical protein
MSGGKIAGIVAILLSVASAVVGILYYLSRHTRRGLVLMIAFAILLIIGILLLVTSGRKRVEPAQK